MVKSDVNPPHEAGDSHVCTSALVEAGTAAASLVSSGCTPRSSAWASRRSALLSSCLCFFFFAFFSSLLFWKMFNSACVRKTLNHLIQSMKRCYQLNRLGKTRGGRQATHLHMVKDIDLTLTFLSLSLSFFFSCLSLLLFFLGSCVAASPSSTGLFGGSAARCALTGSFSLSASGLPKQKCTKMTFYLNLR